MQKVNATSTPSLSKKSPTEEIVPRNGVSFIYNWRDTFFKVALLCIAFILGGVKNCLPTLCAFLVLDRNHRNESSTLLIEKSREFLKNCVDVEKSLNEKRKRLDLDYKKLEKDMQEFNYRQTARLKSQTARLKSQTARIESQTARLKSQEESIEALTKMVNG